jgi:hypothetical protein
MNEDKLTRIESSISGPFTFIWSADLVLMVKEIRRLRAELQIDYMERYQTRLTGVSLPPVLVPKEESPKKKRRVTKKDKMAVR